MPVGGDMGRVFFGAAVDECVRMGLLAEAEALPAIFGQANGGLADLWIAGEEMLCQTAAEGFDRFVEMVFGQGIHGIFHCVGREDAGIVTEGMSGLEVALQ